MVKARLKHLKDVPRSMRRPTSPTSPEIPEIAMGRSSSKRLVMSKNGDHAVAQRCQFLLKVTALGTDRDDLASNDSSGVSLE